MEIYATFFLVCSFSASDGASINVWVTDDENRLPLIIDSPLSKGQAVRSSIFLTLLVRSHLEDLCQQAGKQ